MIRGGKVFRKIKNNSWDIEKRIEECDKGSVDIQVLSTVPVLFSYHAKPKDGLEISKFLNDHIAEVCQKNPDRFMGLGTVPLQDPDLAVEELKRWVTQHQVVGSELSTGSHQE